MPVYVLLPAATKTFMGRELSPNRIQTVGGLGRRLKDFRR
jgi:hypothetical protein